MTPTQILQAATLVHQTQSLLAMALAMELNKGLNISIELKTGGGANPTLYIPASDLDTWLDDRTAENLATLERFGISTDEMLANYKSLAEKLKAKQQSQTPLDNVAGS